MSADDQHNAWDDLFPQKDAADAVPEEDTASDDVPTNGPASAAPPRIVAEAPLGGVPKPIVPPVSPGVGDEGVSPEADEVAPAVTPEPDDVAPDEPLDALPDDAADTVIAQTDTAPEAARAEETPVILPDPDETTIESPTLAAEVQRIAAEVAAEQDAGEVEADAFPVEGEVAPADTAPAPAPAAVEGVGMADASDFDDISPELAAILRKPAAPTQDAAPPAEAEAEPVAAATPDAAPAAPPAPEPEPDAPPIQLTDIAEVRSLPITAEQRNAPAPDTTLTGKVRYVRVEEPLRNDEGQRTQETWEYLKPEYPALGGRLVKEITIEEIAYSDGSWEWRYERRYTDKGRDVREVRANADRNYIEREDEVSRLDAETGRRLQFREETELIFAPPEKEERRGGLLSGLFGRGDDDDGDDSPQVWRDASTSEAKQARKQGGEAFKRGFLGL